jgi:hypothetical protein
MYLSSKPSLSTTGKELLIIQESEHAGACMH